MSVKFRKSNTLDSRASHLFICSFQTFIGRSLQALPCTALGALGTEIDKKASVLKEI